MGGKAKKNIERLAKTAKKTAKNITHPKKLMQQAMKHKKTALFLPFASGGPLVLAAGLAKKAVEHPKREKARAAKQTAELLEATNRQNEILEEQIGAINENIGLMVEAANTPTPVAPREALASQASSVYAQGEDEKKRKSSTSLADYYTRYGNSSSYGTTTSTKFG